MRLLAAEIAAEVSVAAGGTQKQLTPAALTLLAALPWRENLDELRTLLARVVPESAGAIVRLEDILASLPFEGTPAIRTPGPLREARRRFERELDRSIAYIKRYHASGALIALDVDRLKPINDVFGHAAGDQVLKAVVAVLLRNVRSSDVIGRLGGDEFALLLWNMSETDARAKAASLEQAIDGLSFTFRGRTVTAGASAGVAILGPHAEARQALEQADRAMYVRKAQRRYEA